jgi:glycosyltransferase involved in cell wall biosynthesis
MPFSLLYARKQLLPSQSASTLQSMNMAAAFAQAGNRVYSFPGIRTLPVSGGIGGNKPGQAALAPFLREYGLAPEDFAYCRPLRARQRGLYGLSYRAHVLHRYIQGNDIIFTRDVSDALLLCRLRSLYGGKGGKKGRFLFEMHEALFAMHKDQPGKHDWKKTREQEKRILSAVDGIIVVNADIAGLARDELGYSGPAIVEPNGFNPALFKALPLFTPEYPWPDAEDEVHLAYVGNMHESKGVPELIRAMSLLPSRFRLRIIGGGNATAESAMRELATSLGLKERVHFAGYLPQKDLWQACRGCHMAVIPQQPGVAYFSPIKFTESLALGLPLVITPLSAFSERKHLAQVAEDCSPQGIAAAISELAASPQRAETLRNQGLAASAGQTWLARAGRIMDFTAALA